jgi:hypothetical protein
MPSRKKIREYWAVNVDFPWKSFCSPNELLTEDACFACGCSDNGFERAHIYPRSMGGSDKPENLHILCRCCHKDSEGVDGEKYMKWFESRSFADALISRAVRSGDGANVAGVLLKLLNTTGAEA